MFASKEKIKLIVADDSKAFMKALLALISENTAYEVIDVCTDGLALVNSKNLGYADVVLTDIEMPKMNGIQAAKRINQLFNHIPLVALTMHKDKLFLNDIISVGFKGFIYKPEMADNLFCVIDSVLKNKFMFPNDLKLL